MGSVRRNCRSTWMSLCFGTIVGGNRWPPFKHCSASVREGLRRPIAAFEEPGTSRTMGGSHNILGSAEQTV